MSGARNPLPHPPSTAVVESPARKKAGGLAAAVEYDASAGGRAVAMEAAERRAIQGREGRCMVVVVVEEEEE